jgi:hypothetical protein
LTVSPAAAADLVWQLESPFRFFKNSSSFAMYERGYPVARDAATEPPLDVVLRTERRLNDPDCKDMTNPDTCAATARARYNSSRLGWAAQTVDAVCYDSVQNRYPVTCDRRYSWGTAKEDYILPEAHTVVVKLAKERMAEAGQGKCTWSWTPRKPGGKSETKAQPCSAALIIPRVPFSQTRSASGVSVSVTLPDGRIFTDPSVVVDDVLIIALGDSFASGESNPDRPVTFSASREMVYDPVMARDEVASRSVPAAEAPKFGLASSQGYNPKALPRRLMEDERKDLSYRLSSSEFEKAFISSGPRWLSADCHRSQYGYPFRVGLELALENPHRSVTLVSLACTGSEVTEGLFLDKKAREGAANATVRAQLDQLADLICRGGVAGRKFPASYTLPIYSGGSTSITNRTVNKLWCAPDQRKRSIDTVLLSIGGNDVGFSALLLYAMTESASDLAPIAGAIGSQIRYSPQVSRVYMDRLPERMKATREALREGFGVSGPRVVQTAYEPIQFDESGAMCGKLPTLGLDVHPKLAMSSVRLGETVSFLQDFSARMVCMNNGKAPGCSGMATGAGTGFELVTDHLREFAKRGLCARDPKRAQADGEMMAMPRKWIGSDEFMPYSPAAFLPYQHRWRLFRTPNDAFLTANVHSPGFSLFDILQPVYAGMYSGAVHPTAEGHAIVADHVVRHVRKLLDKSAVKEADAR